MRAGFRPSVTTKVFEYPVLEHWRQPRCLLGP
jgi:hypothetical protein